MKQTFWNKIFGDPNAKILKSYNSLVEQVNSLEPTYQDWTQDQFREQTTTFQQQLQAGETTLDDILPQAFAMVREAAKRTLGQRHYDVQLIGGMVIHQGKIAEMRTGEGKTLVATLPTYLNALMGKGVHVVTVNDYLAKRDADWMGQVYDYLGLTVSVINGQQTSYMYDPEKSPEGDLGASADEKQEGGALDEERDEKGSFKIFGEYLRPCSRREAYLADITYGTNNEFGFDYLRDNTQYSADRLVQRDPHFVVIDEIDSILIDEARVPLILSRQADEAEDLYRTFQAVARQLSEGDHYTVDEKLRAVELNDAGIAKAEGLLKVSNLYTDQGVKLVHHLQTAVRAKALFQKDKDYVVRDGEVVIVDAFTGRLQDGRRYSDGLHQALEAKENVAIKQESRTMASITYQNYFKFYKKLSGMTGTAVSSSEEFHKVYGLDVVVIPTNRPIARQDETDLIFQTKKGKFKAIAKKVKELNAKGQPVLIGTVSIENNELLSAYLKEQGVPHQMLNAKNHESEGMITAQAGKKGAVTIATNMAGRGVDIKLGGNPATPEQEQEIKDLGGLYVLGTERHDARRIDNQLRGRAGRQGDPGETQFFVSMEDHLMRVFGENNLLKTLLQRMNLPEDEAIKHKRISGSLEKAQERIEGKNFDARKYVLEYDDVASQHRNIVYANRRKLLEGDTEFFEQFYADLTTQAKEITIDASEAGSTITNHLETMEKKKAELGDDVFYPIMRQVGLQTIDRLWMQHLEVMDRARASVNLRAYGQREPLVEYKKEALRLYREMGATTTAQIVGFLTHLDVEAIQRQIAARQNGGAVESQSPQPASPSSEDLNRKVGRNDKIMIIKGDQEKEIKFKKLDQYIADGWRMK